jgi:hypothetical protein
MEGTTLRQQWRRATMIVVVMGWKQEQSRKAGELAAAAAMLKTIEQMKRSVMYVAWTRRDMGEMGGGIDEDED